MGPSLPPMLDAQTSIARSHDGGEAGHRPALVFSGTGLGKYHSCHPSGREIPNGAR
jgi:hypothetical protein